MSKADCARALGIVCLLAVVAVTVSIPLTAARGGGLLPPASGAGKPGFSPQKSPDHPGDPWMAGELITPEDLLKQMSGPDKPLVLHVGVPTLFKNGHIPGSKHIGQASTPRGIEEVRRQVQDLPRNRLIVLYCGCCPWADCPNIRPAFKALLQMKFSRLRVLHLPNNFGEDWIRKGFSTEK